MAATRSYTRESKSSYEPRRWAFLIAPVILRPPAEHEGFFEVLDGTRPDARIARELDKF